MDMKTKSALIRKLRQEKLWSQEELAKACGLSLRTIQRLENSGSGSVETVRALAAVFEVNADDLVWSEGGFESYRHTQRGDFILIGLIAVASLIWALQMEHQLFSPVVLGVSSAALLVTLVLFYCLTIEVNESSISWYFGPGFWRKTLPLEQIEDCQKVTSPWWWGFGIRAFGSGWLYCVSGLMGVELTLKSGAKIRLGTDEPNFLNAAIRDALDNSLK